MGVNVDSTIFHTNSRVRRGRFHYQHRGWQVIEPLGLPSADERDLDNTYKWVSAPQKVIRKRTEPTISLDILSLKDISRTLHFRLQIS